MANAYAEYVLSFEDFAKVMGDDLKEFHDRAEEIMLVIKLAHDSARSFNMVDFYHHCCMEDTYDSSVFQLLDDDLYDLIKEKLDKLKNLFQIAMIRFERKTGIKVFSEIDYAEDQPYLYMNKKDMMELSPKAKAIQALGVHVELSVWTEYTY
jgi:hypothetical protein